MLGFDERFLISGTQPARSLARHGRCVHLPVASVVHGWGRGNYRNLGLMASTWPVLGITFASGDGRSGDRGCSPHYNGAAYLAEQVASIHRQTLRPQRLLVRDDGSTDGTLKLIGVWSSATVAEGVVFRWKSRLHRQYQPFVGFNNRTLCSSADQDDVWLC